MPPRKRRKRLPRPPKASKRSKRLKREIRRRRYFGPDSATVIRMANLVATNGHPCMTWFWGTSANYLDSLLPAPGTNRGFGVFLPQPTYDALLKAQRRAELAINLKPTQPMPWQGGLPDPTDILGAAFIFVLDLDSDRDDVELPDRHTIVSAGWLFSGDREHGSEARLRATLARIRNALGS